MYVHDVYCKAFTYSRRFTLASISLDGKALPKLYLFSDVLVKLANKTFIPSAVATINNVNATTFIKDASKQSSLTDPDARYNNMIYQPGAAIYGDQNGVIGGRERGKCTDFGDTLVLKHENGRR